MTSETVNLAFHSWFAFDSDLGDGRTVFDLFCAREDKSLSAGERNFLHGLRGSHLRLYEILEVKLVKVSNCAISGTTGRCGCGSVRRRGRS